MFVSFLGYGISRCCHSEKDNSLYSTTLAFHNELPKVIRTFWLDYSVYLLYIFLVYIFECRVIRYYGDSSWKLIRLFLYLYFSGFECSVVRYYGDFPSISQCCRTYRKVCKPLRKGFKIHTDILNEQLVWILEAHKLRGNTQKLLVNWTAKLLHPHSLCFWYYVL